MKKKKYLYIILLLLSISCSKEKNNNRQIVGEWHLTNWYSDTDKNYHCQERDDELILGYISNKYVFGSSYEEYYIFKDDNTIIMTFGGKILYGEWFISSDGNMLTIVSKSLYKESIRFDIKKLRNKKMKLKIDSYTNGTIINEFEKL